MTQPHASARARRGIIAHMKSLPQTITVALAACVAGYSQSSTVSPKLEFEVAAIRAAAPGTGHFGPRASTRGGPGTSSPTIFRCTGCNLSFLISKAFELERYQFPGRTSLPDTAFDISATIPEGATAEQFLVMLQNLLKSRFNLAYRFEKKPMQGYELVVAKGGHKLKEASAGNPEAPKDWHSAGQGGSYDPARSGLMFFNGQGKYRGEKQTTADLARMISNQLAKPVDDHTGLQGKYDISLSWTDDGSHAATHAGAATDASGGKWAGHGEAGGGTHGGRESPASEASGIPLIGAVQTQLGLKLEKSKATANIFILDHVEKSPAEN